MANSNGAETASNPDIPPDAAQGGALNKKLDQQVDQDKGIDQEAERTLRKQKRTLGLKILDNGLYTVLNNVAVGAVSVLATYVTQAKRYENARGWNFNGFLGQLHRRSGWYTGKLQALGANEAAAKALNMVTWSFVDGSIMAPLVKVVEDKREPIAEKIDEMLGTKPDDLSVYEAEPKQTWGSLLKGRVATLSIVLPVAVTLSSIGTRDQKWGYKSFTSKESEQGAAAFESLNDKMFSKPGERIGAWLEKRNSKILNILPPEVENLSPEKRAKLGITDINVEKADKNFKSTPKLIFKIGVFEAFYTSVCTVGLYIGSRFFARKNDAKLEAANTNAAPIASSAANTNAAPVTVENQPTAANLNEAPGTKLHAAQYDNTVSGAPEKALAAG